MIAWLIYFKENALKNRKYIDFYITEGKKLYIDFKLILVEDIEFGVEKNQWFIRHQGRDIAHPDFVICRAIYPLLSKHLEFMGIKVFNNSLVSEICNDKAKTYQYLANTGIKMVDTKFYKNFQGEDILNKVKSPTVIKAVDGHGGSQVFLYNPSQYYSNDEANNISFDIKSKDNLIYSTNVNSNDNTKDNTKDNIIDSAKDNIKDNTIDSAKDNVKDNTIDSAMDNSKDNTNFSKVVNNGGNESAENDNSFEKRSILQGLGSSDLVVQPLVGYRHQDLRVYVIGKEIIAAVLRTAREGFKSNFSLGGEVKLYHLSDTEISIVNTIIKQFDFGLVGIDFIIGDYGELIFNEIEDVVGSRMLYQCSNINIVEKYLQYIYNIIKQG